MKSLRCIQSAPPLKSVFFVAYPGARTPLWCLNAGAKNETLRSFTQETEEADDLTSCLSFGRNTSSSQSSKCNFAKGVSREGSGAALETLTSDGIFRVQQSGLAQRLNHLWRDFFFFLHSQLFQVNQRRKKRKQQQQQSNVITLSFQHRKRLQKQKKQESIFISPSNWQ